MTLDVKQSIIAWVSVTAFVALFTLSLALHLERFIPQWMIDVWQNWVMPGFLLSLLIFQLGKWLSRRFIKRSEMNG